LEPDLSGLTGVSIPIWTSKTFAASWEMPLTRLPFEADLVYHTPSSEVKVSGTLKSNLPMDLEEAWIFYRNRPVALGTLPAGKVQASATEKEQEVQGWAGLDAPKERGRTFEATPLLKEILFQEKVDIGVSNRNHALRGLDLSWRMREDEKDTRGTVREI